MKSIMLVDDNHDDNFIHSRIIKKIDAAAIVITKKNGEEALDFLKSKTFNIEAPLPPDMIFLDINMPGMNGWEFLSEYKKLDIEILHKTVMVMLTTSDNPDDIMKAKSFSEISEFKTKPLTKEMLLEIIEKHVKKP